MRAVATQPYFAAELLAPVTAALRSMSRGGQPAGLVPGLLVHDETGWLQATRLLDGSLLPDLLEFGQRRWKASAHAAASLAWKTYSYWLTLPAALGWTCARRVPLLYPTDVLLRLTDGPPTLAVGLRPSVTVAVLAGDPLARYGSPRPAVVRDESAMLAALRESVLDAHLRPLAGAIQTRTRVGMRVLFGSLSSGIADGLLRAARLLPRATVDEIDTLLHALGIDHLVDLARGGTGAPAVRRRTCCLAFTLPEPKVCAGFCLRGEAAGALGPPNLVPPVRVTGSAWMPAVASKRGTTRSGTGVA